MDKWLKQFQKLKLSTQSGASPSGGFDYLKYLALFGIVITNGIFVLPTMKKMYNKYFSNNAEISHVCYFDIDLEGQHFGRIDVGLYGQVAPQNINNFLHLITKTDPYKTYEGSKVFRIIPKYIVQMGDILNNNGTGHISHYESNEFVKDEINNSVSFCEAGVVAMANRGPNTNGSQFFITLDELPYLDGKYTIIGQTIKGFEKLKKLSSICGNVEGLTNCNVKISSTGIYNFADYMKNKELKI